MAVTMEHVPGKGFQVSGIIPYSELSGMKKAKAYTRGEETVTGSDFRSAFSVIRVKGVAITDEAGKPYFGGEHTLADAKFQATLTVRNFRKAPTAEEIAAKKHQQTVERVARDISSLSELDQLRLIPRYRNMSDEELQAVLDASE